MVENDVYETKKSFVNVIRSLRFIKCPVVWFFVHLCGRKNTLLCTKKACITN
jgi:hypothetical protein